MSGWKNAERIEVSYASLLEDGNYRIEALSSSVGIKPTKDGGTETFLCEDEDEACIGTVHLVPGHYAWQSRGNHGVAPLDQWRRNAENPSNNPPKDWAIGCWIFVERLQRGNVPYGFVSVTYGFIGMDQGDARFPSFAVSAPAIGGNHAADSKKLVQDLVSRVWGFANIAGLPDQTLTVDGESLKEVLSGLKLGRFSVQAGGQASKRGLRVLNEDGSEMELETHDRRAGRNAAAARGAAARGRVQEILDRRREEKKEEGEKEQVG